MTMNRRNDIEEQIDRYATGRMTPRERTAFEERLRHDPELARETETAGHIVNALERRNEEEALGELSRIGSVDELRRVLDGAERRIAGTAPRPNLLRRLIPFAAAAAVILGFVWVGMRPEHVSDELYGRWYETPEYAPAISRGGGETDAGLERQLNSAAIHYAAGDFDKAIAAYARATKLGLEHPDYARFYRGAALAAAGRSREAISIFRLLAEDPDSEYAEDAAWQLALEYLRQNNRAQARKTLESLVAKEGPCADSARKLLRELNARKWF